MAVYLDEIKKEFCSRVHFEYFLDADAMKAVTMAFTPSMLEKMPMFIMKRSITAKEMEPEAGS